jgi:hypothetical protein
MHVDIQIMLERRGTNALKPRGGDRKQVAPNSTVTFAVEENVTGTTVVFDGGKSPFDQATVGYSERLKVTATFDQNPNNKDPNKNVYPFKCHGRGPNGEELDSTNGGGEMEIVGH